MTIKPVIEGLNQFNILLTMASSSSNTCTAFGKCYNDISASPYNNVFLRVEPK